MIICKACGHHNADGEEFCSSCGRYLEWAGERVENPEVPAPVVSEPEPEVEAVRPGIVERVRSAVGHPVRPTAAPVAPAPVAPAPADSAPHGEAPGLAPVTEQLPVLVADGGVAAPTDEAALDEGSAATAAASATERTLALRRPTEAAASAGERRRPPAFSGLGTSTTSARPDDVSCPVCHVNNEKSRTYCRHCGTDLVEFAAPPPRYQPIGFFRRHFSRDVEIVPVGERPGKWGKAASAGRGSERYMRIAGRAGAFLVGAGLILSFIGPVALPIRNRVDSAYSRVIHAIYVTYTQQFAVGATATTANPKHPAGYAVDDLLNDYWLSMPSRRTHGAGQSISVTFAVPTTLDYLGVLSGAGPTQQTFLSESRPKQILITFSNGFKKQETLQDKSAFQRLNIHVAGVTSLKFQILSVYPSATGNAVALSEIEFFQRT